MQKKRHTVPAILSLFIPGLGQAVKGQLVKAILIWIGGGLMFFFLFWTFVPYVFWAWNIYDAYFSNAKADAKKVTEKLEEEEHPVHPSS